MKRPTMHNAVIEAALAATEASIQVTVEDNTRSDSGAGSAEVWGQRGQVSSRHVVTWADGGKSDSVVSAIRSIIRDFAATDEWVKSGGSVEAPALTDAELDRIDARVTAMATSVIWAAPPQILLDAISLVAEVRRLQADGQRAGTQVVQGVADDE